MKRTTTLAAGMAVLFGLAVGASLGSGSATAAADHTWETLICGNFFPILNSVERCDEDALEWANEMEAAIPVGFSPQAGGNVNNALVTIDSGAGGHFCLDLFSSGTSCSADTASVAYLDYVAVIGY